MMIPNWCFGICRITRLPNCWQKEQTRGEFVPPVHEQARTYVRWCQSPLCKQNHSSKLEPKEKTTCNVMQPGQWGIHSYTPKSELLARLQIEDYSMPPWDKLGNFPSVVVLLTILQTDYTVLGYYKNWCFDQCLHWLTEQALNSICLLSRNATVIMPSSVK